MALSRASRVIIAMGGRGPLYTQMMIMTMGKDYDDDVLGGGKRYCNTVCSVCCKDSSPYL